MKRSLIAAAVLAIGSVIATNTPAGAHHGGPHRGDASATNNGDSATGNARDTRPGRTPYDEGPSTGPRCWYHPLYFTTQEEQRTEIRPEEQRPGVWGWWECDDGTSEFRFFPDAEPIDPLVLARSVTITPGPPALQTNPPLAALQLVNLTTWFWVDPASWVPVTDGTSAGSVSVTVTATPRTLVVNPGDGSGTIQCVGGGTPYNPGLAPEDQSSTCTHTYEASGDFTATATIIYDVTWTSNVTDGPQSLGTLTPAADSFQIQVAEGQAIVVTGGGRGGGAS